MQRGVHPDIVAPITWLQQRGSGGGQQRQLQHQTLIILQAYNVDLQSVQYLADFLQGDTHLITELVLFEFKLVQPSDGGLDVLINLFANQQAKTHLTKVKLAHGNFGSVEDASRLIATLQSNRLVTDLAFFGIENLQGVALGNCISGVLQNSTYLQRLELGPVLTTEVIRAFQPGLRENRTLKDLDLCACELEDEGLHLIADALVGNTIIEVFDISNNDNIGADGLADITRLVNFTLLKKIYAAENVDLFSLRVAMKNFILALHQNTSLEELIGLDLDEDHEDAGIFVFNPTEHKEQLVAVDNILVRNRILRCANALLAPRQPRTGLPIGSKSGIWCKAMATMGRSHRADTRDDARDNGADAAPTTAYPGISAIFKIFQARPAILEYQLPRPSASDMQRLERDNRARRRQKRRRTK